jgi:hypothetical protein
LKYLGVETSFDEFAEANALGGLELLRVLIPRTGRVISSSQLIEKSKSCADPSQVATYLSRMRNVLKQKSEHWPQAVKDGPEFKSAKSAFVVSDKSARREAPGKETWYRLDLPAYRVRYIRAD